MGTLTDKYCIVGVGETPHMRPSNRTTLSMACEACAWRSQWIDDIYSAQIKPDAFEVLIRAARTP